MSSQDSLATSSNPLKVPRQPSTSSPSSSEQNVSPFSNSLNNKVEKTTTTTRSRSSSNVVLPSKFSHSPSSLSPSSPKLSESEKDAIAFSFYKNLIGNKELKIHNPEEGGNADLNQLHLLRMPQTPVSPSLLLFNNKNKKTFRRKSSKQKDNEENGDDVEDPFSYTSEEGSEEEEEGEEIEPTALITAFRPDFDKKKSKTNSRLIAPLPSSSSFHVKNSEPVVAIDDEYSETTPLQSKFTPKYSLESPASTEYAADDLASSSVGPDSPLLLLVGANRDSHHQQSRKASSTIAVEIDEIPSQIIFSEHNSGSAGVGGSARSNSKTGSGSGKMGNVNNSDKEEREERNEESDHRRRRRIHSSNQQQQQQQQTEAKEDGEEELIELLSTSQVNKHKSSSIRALYNLFCSMAGAGTLQLPLALSQSGWLGIVLIMMSSIFSNYTAKILIRSMYAKPAKKLRTYVDIGGYAFGLPGRLITRFFQVLTLFGICTLFQLLACLFFFFFCCFVFFNLNSLRFSFLATNFQTIFQIYPNKFTSTLFHLEWTLICALLVLPISYLKTMKEISVLAFFGSAASLIVAIITIVLTCISIATNGVATTTYVASSWSNLALGFATVNFCFTGHPVFPTIENNMKNPKRFRFLIDFTFVLLIVLYLPMAILSYLVWVAKQKKSKHQSKLKLKIQFKPKRLMDLEFKVPSFSHSQTILSKSPPLQSSEFT